jgi:selenocysteine lyase/cysteine desulfurase
MFSAEQDNMLANVLVGVPQVAELIAGLTEKSRRVALDAAAQSYLRAARELGYGEAAAQQWAAAVMERLQDEMSRFAGAAISP